MNRTQIDIIAAAVAVLVLLLTVLIADAARGQTTDRRGFDHGAAAASFQVSQAHDLSSGRSQGNVARNFQPISRDQRLVTHFWRASEFALVTSAVADGGTTHVLLTNGSGCTESFPGLRGHPSDLQVWGWGALAHGGGLALEELIHRRARKSSDAHVAMIFINVGVTVAHAFAAVGNSHCL